jgi:hypothetical protein
MRALFQEKTEVRVSGNLPALYKTEIALCEEHARTNFSLSSTKSRGSSINMHGVHGAQAAEGVSLSRQVGTTTGRNQLS